MSRAIDPRRREASEGEVERDLRAPESNGRGDRYLLPGAGSAAERDLRRRGRQKGNARAEDVVHRAHAPNGSRVEGPAASGIAEPLRAVLRLEIGLVPVALVLEMVADHRSQTPDARREEREPA